MSDQQLTTAEIETLISALNIWKDNTVDTGDLMRRVFSCSSTEEANKKLEQIKEDAMREQRQRQEIAILLQAKLLMMRNLVDKLDIQGVAEALREGKL
jgi:L-fucose isomerase-like protein